MSKWMWLSLPMIMASGCRGEAEQRRDRPRPTTSGTPVPPRVALPAPATGGALDGAHKVLAELMQRRRSRRSFSARPLALAELSQLLWAAQGISQRDADLRTAPSAGALHPLIVFVVAGHVSGIAAGVYRYAPHDGVLQLVARGDKREQLARHALQQSFIAQAPATLVITASFARSASKYGARATRYVHIEVGHAAQNVCLMATALDLATVPVGAFDDPRVTRLLGLPDELAPLLLLPVGPPR